MLSWLQGMWDWAAKERMFWLAIAVLFVAFVYVQWLHGSTIAPDRIRYAGTVLQAAGIASVWWGYEQTRRLFGFDYTLIGFWRWLTSAPKHRFAGNLGRSEATNFVAVHGSAIVGFITVLIDGPDSLEPHLWCRLRPYAGFLGVLREHRNQGIGSGLIRVGAEATISQMRPRLWLECAESNERFFAKRGFVRASPEAIEQTYGLRPEGPVLSIDLTAALRLPKPERCDIQPPRAERS